MKTAKDKILVSGVFNDSEGLYGTTFCRCLVRRPHYSARLLRFGSRGLGELPPKCLDDRDCVVRRVQGRGMAMSTVASEKKNGIVIYQQRFFQTVTSLRVVSLLF